MVTRIITTDVRDGFPSEKFPPEVMESLMELGFEPVVVNQPPEPEVEVTTDQPETGKHRATVTVRLSGSSEVTQTGEGSTPNEAFARSVKRLLGDRRILEHIDR
jgi:hypothetical protein